MTEIVTADHISARLRDLGLAPGDMVMMHCSLTSVGRVQGGADGLINAVLDAVSPGGTVMMPALPSIHTPFDVRTSPSTVGLVSEVFRRRPEAVRSRHPSHSVAAIGPQAAWLTDGHERTEPTGLDSPYDRLRARNGWILLLGVDHDRNTMLHLAETLAGVPYLRQGNLQTVDESGGVRTIAVPKMAYGHRQFIGLDRPLTEVGLQSIGRVGDAVARVMRAGPLIEFVVDLLRTDPAALLCSKPTCIFCRWARARVAEVRDGTPDNTDWPTVTAIEGCGVPGCECCVV